MQKNIQLRTRIRNGIAIATATLATNDGPLQLRATVPVATINRALQLREMRVRGCVAGDELVEVVGWGFFKKISKKAKKLAKKLARSKVLKSALKIANNPIVSSFLPGSAVTALRYLEKGRKLVEMSNRGNPGAKNLVNQVRLQAQFKKNPNPTTYAMIQRLQRMNSKRLGRPVGNPLFSMRFDKAIRACA